MTVTDDPASSDDVEALLRRATSGLDISPAPLRTVERRARQRRHRRHGVLAAGATVLVLLAGVAVVDLTGDDGSEHVVSATQPEPQAGASAPQPLLVPGGPSLRVIEGNAEPTQVRRRLDELTPSGPTRWWTAEPEWLQVGGVELADGRRFGLANRFADGEPFGQYVLDEIGPEHTSVGSVPITVDAPGAWNVELGIVGAVGSDVVFVQTSTFTPELANDPQTPASTPRSTAQTVFTYDVDTGARRTVSEDGGGGLASSAGGILARSIGADCTITVQPLSETGEPRELHGGCPAGFEGLAGLAIELEVSPDGRYVAVLWSMIRPTGLPDSRLDVLDAQTGTRVYEVETEEWPVASLAWTGERTLTAAVDPGTASAPRGGDPVTVETLEWEGVGG